MTWEMFKKMVENYFFLNLNEYFDGVSFPINLFILSFSVGVCIAIFFASVHNIYTYNILRQLIRHEAWDAQSAKTLTQLHVKPSYMLRSALSRRGQLTSMVKMVTDGTDIDAKNAKIDFSTAKFYIGEGKDRAKRISEGTRPTYLNAILFSSFIIIVSLIVSILMPEILAFLSGTV